MVLFFLKSVADPKDQRIKLKLQMVEKSLLLSLRYLLINKNYCNIISQTCKERMQTLEQGKGRLVHASHCQLPLRAFPQKRNVQYLFLWPRHLKSTSDMTFLHTVEMFCVKSCQSHQVIFSRG